jgi:hypothetical protein
MPLLSQLGIVELTVGVLSGWLMVLTIESPGLLRRAGMRHLGRIRQAHLDLLFQGVILVAVGLAVDPLPTQPGSAPSSLSAPSSRPCCSESSPSTPSYRRARSPTGRSTP